MVQVKNKLKELIKKGFVATRSKESFNVCGDEARTFISQETGMSVSMIKKIESSDDPDLIKDSLTDDVPYLLARATKTEPEEWLELTYLD